MYTNPRKTTIPVPTLCSGSQAGRIIPSTQNNSDLYFNTSLELLLAAVELTGAIIAVHTRMYTLFMVRFDPIFIIN
jgi:hypothetical protein